MDLRGPSLKRREVCERQTLRRLSMLGSVGRSAPNTPYRRVDSSSFAVHSMAQFSKVQPSMWMPLWSETRIPPPGAIVYFPRAKNDQSLLF